MLAHSVASLTLRKLGTSQCYLTFYRSTFFADFLHAFVIRYFTFLTECKTPKACTILLRGPSKDILNEIDRNLADAMSVARNVVFNPMLAPGGGATEMAVSVGLQAKARSVTGVEGWPFRAVADAMEVIPRTLVQNSGGNAIRVLTELRVSY
jgi:T-complex protein 1 subunit gamma